MTDQPTKNDQVIIKAKRLDSDDVSETTVEVPASRSEMAIRSQLAAIVGSHHPDAEFRSFADGAATFLASKLLIVAIYLPSGDGGRPSEGDDDESQQQLFAA